MLHLRSLRRTAKIVGALAIATALVAPTAAAADPASSNAANPTPSSRQSPQVTHTGTAPTGYTVTFRYNDKTATRVQLKGEWYFSNPFELAKLAGSSEADVVQSQGVPPSQWQPGDVPLPYPNATAANWPVVDMTEIGNSGEWTYTTPLPSGVFSYGFFVNCTSPTQSGCTQLVDPNNQPWNRAGTGYEITTPQSRRSQVYVPSDPKFGTLDLSWQAPSPRPGTLADVAYPAPTSTTPAGHNYLSVYTPPGYDPNRAQPYPTLYVMCPDDEVGWTTQGDLSNILDNLINDGEIQPVVLVSPNTRGFPASSDSSVFDANLLNYVIPYVEAHYNVSTSASLRAVGGIGNSASIVSSLLFKFTTKFGYYGVWGSPAPGNFTLPPAASITPAQIAALQKTGIQIGGGTFDPHDWFHRSEIALLTSVGVQATSTFVLGGHEWYSWRQNARDFLTRVAFLPLATGALTAGG